ncbi:MAG: hypothetical protein ACP5NZ_04695 [Nanobdellota archaeon]
MKKNKENKKDNHVKKQLIWIFWTTIIVVVGLIIFKYLPMYLYGEDILYDLSSHVIWTIWGLYIVWFFIDQKKSWRIPYFILAGAVVIIMSIQRIIARQHNEIGVILAIVVGGLAIVVPRWKELTKGVEF